MANEFEEVEVSEVVKLNNLQIYQQDKALIDMQIATARAYPRDLRRAIENAITLVTLDAETADSCFYSLKKGGKNIIGPSVHLAKILAQQMGNMRVENRVVGFDSTHVTVEAVCFDLERNFAIRTQIKKSIVGSSGRYSEDMQVITANAANAIALRNAIFAVVDAGIVKKVFDSAKKKVAGDVSDETKLMARRTTVVNGFKTTYAYMNLTDAEICGAVGKASIDHINADDIVALIGFENAIRNGEMKPDEIFRPSKLQQQKPVVEDKSEERMILLINAAKSVLDLEKLKSKLTTNKTRIAYDEAFKKLK